MNYVSRTISVCRLHSSIVLTLVLAACAAVDDTSIPGALPAASPQPLVDLPNCPDELSSASLLSYCLFNSAVLLRDAGYRAEAEKEFLKVLEVDEEHLLARRYLGDIYFEEENFELAERMYVSVIALDGTNALDHENLGVVYERRGETEEAIASYLAAIRIYPSNPETHYKLGLAYSRERGTMDQAIAAFLRAIELDATNPNYHFNLARIYEYIGRSTMADRHYRAAAELGVSP